MEENNSVLSKKNNNAVFGLFFVIIVVVIIAGTTMYETKSKQTHVSTVAGSVSAQTANNPSPTISSLNKSFYKDGTYSADGSYTTHAATESIGVKLTLKNDVITDVSLTEEPTDDISRMHQDDFAANYKQFVIGKKIASVHLDKISMSSLTPIGFNDALQKIEAQAKAS